ncbi:MAG: zinc-ribbon domain-containing protein [Promethearchaeota archaeon]|nr:MAG: zinc-ribbon domain-containing protein [Candidatus Lokiarchaeota archaeon]
MYNQLNFQCENEACGNNFTVPRKMVRRGNTIIIEARCPRCNRHHRYQLPYEQRYQWIPAIKDLLLRCEFCGTSNIDNYNEYGSSSSISMSFSHEVIVKILINCKKCGRKSKKVYNKFLWDEIKSQEYTKSMLIKHKPQSSSLCPFCGAYFSPSSQVCPKCHSRVRCDNCGVMIKKKSAKFCNKCGNKLVSDTEKLFCENCGAPIVPGAQFCVECGNEIDN